MSFQNCLTSLLLWNTKDILRFFFSHIIGVNGVKHVLVYQCFVLFSNFTEESAYRHEGWVNAFIFGWSVSLRWSFITCFYDWLGNVSSSLKFHSWYFWNLLWNKHDTSWLGLWSIFHLYAWVPSMGMFKFVEFCFNSYRLHNIKFFFNHLY